MGSSEEEMIQSRATTKLLMLMCYMGMVQNRWPDRQRSLANQRSLSISRGHTDYRPPLWRGRAPTKDRRGWSRPQPNQLNRYRYDSKHPPRNSNGYKKISRNTNTVYPSYQRQERKDYASRPEKPSKFIKPQKQRSGSVSGNHITGSPNQQSRQRIPEVKSNPIPTQNSYPPPSPLIPFNDKQVNPVGLVLSGNLEQTKSSRKTALDDIQIYMFHGNEGLGSYKQSFIPKTTQKSYIEDIKWSDATVFRDEKVNIRRPTVEQKTERRESFTTKRPWTVTARDLRPPPFATRHTTTRPEEESHPIVIIAQSNVESNVVKTSTWSPFHFGK